MTQEEYRAAMEDVIYLASCAVKGEAPDKTRVAGMDLGRLYSAADRHLLTGVTAYALESAGVFDPAFTQAKAKAIRKIVLFDSERAAVLRELDKAGIWHMPLKGAVLKDYYPAIGMRQMADNDILFDAARADDVKTIMEGLGFSTVYFDTSNHDVYHKAPVSSFEMHRSLFGPSHDEKLYEYYRNAEERLLGDGYEKHLGPEDFYIYVTAHEYMHYSVSGTGLRSVLDTYVYLQKVKLDMGYVTTEAEKLGMAEFEAANRSLAQHLFSGESLTEADRELLEYILSSGVYGTRTNLVQNRLSTFGHGKIHYMLKRFAEPLDRKSRNYQTLSKEFPFFYKHRALLPCLTVYRVFLRLKEGKLKAELEALKKAKEKLGKR